MAAQGAHRVTEQFEQELARYTGAPYVACVDSASNGLYLALLRHGWKGEITIPCRTYPSVPMEIIRSGSRVKWAKMEQVNGLLSGEYQLMPTRVWDSALRFTSGMYRSGALQCVSFTGAFKQLKLGKGGAILCDSKEDWEWLKRARNSGRNECSYHEDNFTMLGINAYMMPTVSALGLLLINQCYNLDGTPKHFPDAQLPYPDLSKFPIFTQ